MQKLLTVLLTLCVATTTSCNSVAQSKSQPNPYYSRTATTPVNVSNAQWKKILAPGVYNIAREQGTERAYTGLNWNNHKDGTYYCAVCGNRLFSSDAKFESGTGWPSFFQPYSAASVKQKTDADGDRQEIECARCGSHLGHVFNDGPNPTGLRYCMNGNVMDFVAGKK